MNLCSKIFVPLLCAAVWGGIVGCAKEKPAVAVPQAVYHCPMHPRYTSDRPGECPICHMDLVLVESHGKTTEDQTGDRVMVSVSDDKEQWIGVRTAVVGSKVLEKKVRAAATVAYDPDLNSVFAEHRELLAARDRAAKRNDPQALATATAMVKASRVRLAQQGLTEKQIDRSLLQGAGDGNPISQGAGKHSARWVYVQVYENEADLIEPGQKVELTSPSLAAPLEGTVDSVDRIIDPESRTLRVRVSVSGNVPWARMYLEAAIRVPLGDVLAVPKEAVIDTGLRRLVYVQTQKGHYAPREVSLGRETDDDYEVLDGLMEDDVVAASGQFLIDSESRLRAIVTETSHGH